MEDEFLVTKAARKAVPMLISLSGTSGSGKTFSGLLLAAGMAKGGQVGMIDAENGRGTLYEDDPMIRAALPGGYLYTGISAPYNPARYVKALQAMESAGVKVCLIDSTSHEWEGEGGCTDIAENQKLRGMPNWAAAKLQHKKFLAYCLSSPMHIVFCLRAREKTKIVKDEKGKDQFVAQGIQPVAEKNFVFEMLLSLMFDEATHQYVGVKVPKMLAGIFKGGELITQGHGASIREWADGGMALDPAELLKKRARSAAELGMVEYSAMFGALSPPQKKMLADSTHAENKAIAEIADASQVNSRLAELETHERFYQVLGNLGHPRIEEIPAVDRAKVLAIIEAELGDMRPFGGQ